MLLPQTADSLCAGVAEHYGKQEVRLLSGSVAGVGRSEDSLVMDELNLPVEVAWSVNSSTFELINADESVGLQLHQRFGLTCHQLHHEQ